MDSEWILFTWLNHILVLWYVSMLLCQFWRHHVMTVFHWHIASHILDTWNCSILVYTWYLELFYSCLPVGEKSRPVAGEIWIKLLDGLHLPIERLMQACWRLKDTLECSFFSGSFDIRRHCYLIFCFGRDFFFNEGGFYEVLYWLFWVFWLCSSITKPTIWHHSY